MKQIHLIKEKIDSLNDRIWAKELILKKDELLIKRGEYEHHLYFVLEGALVVLYTNEEEGYTIRFGYKDTFICSLDSFINDVPSVFDIKAIKKSRLVMIERTQFLEFIKDYQLNQMWVRALSELTSQYLTQEIDLITKTPIERYNRLLERNPRVFQEIPNRYLASYLRMTPETLSRLKKS